MFGTMKKAMVAGAVVAAAALAGPAMASAGPVWNTNATDTSNAQAAHGEGQLTLELPGGATTTCDVTVTADLWNGTDAGTTRGLGEVTTFLLGQDMGGECTTSYSGCIVSATADTSSPWAITVTNDGTVDISGISFTNNYSGGVSCPLNGLALQATGAIGGNMAAPGVLEFDEALGLTTIFGDPSVSGEVEMVWEDDGTPVELS